jgi:serine/threonine protein kinase
VDPACDLFSLGATLYAAVEGRSPFGKGRTAAILDAVVTDPPAPLRRAGPLGPVIEGLLAKDPARRLGPDQARGALQAIQRRTATAHPGPPARWPPTSSRTSAPTAQDLEPDAARATTTAWREGRCAPTGEEPRIAAPPRDDRVGQQRLQGGNSGRTRPVTARPLHLHRSAAAARRARPDRQGGRQ